MKALILTGVLALAPLSPTPDEFDLAVVAEEMRVPGVLTTWHWEDCGQVNAYYYPRRKDVTLCNELREFGPGVVRFIFAHELAHGIIRQRGIAYTGSEEVAADELAAVVLAINHRVEDVEAAAEFFNEHVGESSPWDPHPSGPRRYFTLSCLADQSQGKYPWLCDSDYGWLRALSSWTRLLKL